jgi:hypothetical protein
MQDTTENERKHHTPIIKEKEFKPNKSRLLLFSFLLKTKQTQASYAVRAAKRTEEALRQIFKSYHHYLMKALN